MAVAPSNFASALSNTVAITINVDDVVFVLVNNGDNTTPAGFLDSGGNIYGIADTDSNAARGSSILYVCSKAAFSATSVSFTAGHSPSIAVGTFSGATGVNAAHTKTTGSTNSPDVGNVATKVANSYTVMLMAFLGTAATASANTGTKQTSTASTTTVAGMAIATLVAATVGNYDPRVNLSASDAFVGFTFEIWSAIYDVYEGVVPPLAREAVRYRVSPIISGGTSGGPVTPVPIGAVLKSGNVGIAYSETISAQGGSGTGYTFAVTGGALPTGTSLNTSSGVISGTPTTVGTYSFTITVTDSLSNTGSQAFQIVIAAATVTVVATVLPAGDTATVYGETVSASGGSGGYTYAVTSGALPTGLSLGAGTGIISGTPTVVGSYSFTITATDSSANTGSQAFSIEITVPVASGGSYIF